MDRSEVIAGLKSQQHQLQALGLRQISLFGSTARGEATADSDVDLAVTFDDAARIGLFRFGEITERLRQLLGTRVDMVVEPLRNPRMQAEIERDRVRVF